MTFSATFTDFISRASGGNAFLNAFGWSYDVAVCRPTRLSDIARTRAFRSQISPETVRGLISLGW
jgi:hypothetical protein